MEVKIDVQSKEIIKPSVPTPENLRHYQLSFLDQITVPVYSPLIILFPKNPDAKLTNREKSDKLKQSLCEVLTHFYPLSGRIRDNLYVECNDEGILYSEANVDCDLSELVDHSSPDELRKLIPFQLDGVQEVPLGVQFNIFNCGGVAVTLAMSHKLGDGLSTIYFVKFWAALTRGESVPAPQFDSATLFPPNDLGGFDPATGITKQKVVAKRFLFKSSSVEAIREKYSEKANLENQKPPSRIESLSVFMYTRFMSSTSKETRQHKIYFMLHAVNLRTRMEPPLPECSFGNYYRVAISFPKPGDDGFSMVKQVRDSIKSVDQEYVKNLQHGTQYLQQMTQMAESYSRGDLASLNFTSLCNFPLYEADFGWGKPLWVGFPSLTFINLVIFMDSASGDGIEALVHLSEEDMNKFSEDEELLQFVAAKEY